MLDKLTFLSLLGNLTLLLGDRIYLGLDRGCVSRFIFRRSVFYLAFSFFPLFGGCSGMNGIFQIH